MVSRYGHSDFNIASELNDTCLLTRKQEVNTDDKIKIWNWLYNSLFSWIFRSLLYSIMLGGGRHVTRCDVIASFFVVNRSTDKNTWSFKVQIVVHETRVNRRLPGFSRQWQPSLTLRLCINTRSWLVQRYVMLIVKRTFFCCNVMVQCVEVHRYFEGTSCLRIQGPRVTQASCIYNISGLLFKISLKNKYINSYYTRTTTLSKPSYIIYSRI
jgi:hypothetical protein